MTLLAKDYAGRSRDSRWERDLAAELRKLPESERLQFILELAHANAGVVVELVKKCLTTRESLLAVLDHALAFSGASGIQYWLESVVPKLGYRRTVSYLRERASLNPREVAKAAYHLPMFSNLPGYRLADRESLLAG